VRVKLVFVLILVAFAAACQAKEPVLVVMETTAGDITLELYPDKAPQTVENFLRYVNDGFYDNTLFHRIIPGFVVQGGGFEPGMSEKGTYDPIKNEAANGLKNDRGTISMARTSVVDSATSQFFINLNDNVPLNHRDKTQRGYGYAVFGKVVEGMDVVDKIAATPTGTVGRFSDVPRTDVMIVTARRKEAEK
jgi:cyclophilin family peptidyl-prolyl cis-trans isomerase